ncbi:AMP-binding protein [Asticcacaulis endophyticus]|uniref:AMP-dependent synthetase/ligase domain-containing protein n=1 Tax=Asticcacaulis endophyticus TaxID=1395890 RepID=A0A918UY35_9CAUL|nr:AMP-binding protein [Asticcacaulis endophyticus]GGZ43155.1 hypothetical protein GCM10011273_32450 [Asticcacaulis endophyticus]
MRIQDTFLSVCERKPSSPCLKFDARTYSYRDVRDRSGQVAWHLTQAGIIPGDVVAIIAERGPELIWSILGVLRAGAIFTVVDSAYPAARINTLFAQVRPNAIITCGGAHLKSIVYALTSPPDIHLHLADLDMRRKAEFNDPATSPDAPAYYLFTSGSTGHPKVVACHHTPLVRFVDWHKKTFDLSARDQFTLLSGLSHDPLLRDIFTPLSVGAVLNIPAQSTITAPGALRTWLHKVKATVVHLTPPMGQLLLAGCPKVPTLKAIRRFFWGGDQLQAGLVTEMKTVAPNAEHINFYGSTETPQAAAFYRLPSVPSDQPIPLGKGSDGFELIIVNTDKQPVAMGETGEIAVKSAYLSLGYARNGQISAPDDRHHSADGQTIYYTGDRGYMNADGQVIGLGRADDQIKIRGYRVDLSEITAALNAHPDLCGAIALTTGDGDNRRIEAFVSPKYPLIHGVEALRRHFASVLPVYMVPSKFWVMEHGLPLLPNGKIDRQALIALASEPDKDLPVAMAESDDPRVNTLIGGWRKVFQRRDITPDSTFVGLGGDSLSYVGAFLAAEEVVGGVPEGWQSLPLKDIVARARPRDKMFAAIDSTIMIRAVAIIFLVGLHFGLGTWGNGMTTALFIVSGFLYGRTQWDNMFASGKFSALLKPLKAILPATFVCSVAVVLIDMAKGGPVYWPMLTLTTDMFASPNEPLRHTLYWYTHDLIKLILLTAGVQWGLQKLWPNTDRLRLTIGVMLGLCAIRFGLPTLFTDMPVDYFAPNTIWLQLNPVSNLALFYMGIVMSQLKVDLSKQTMMILCLITGSINSFYFSDHSALGVIISAFLIMYVPTIYVMRGLSKIVYLIGGATLYIYLGQIWMAKPLQYLLGHTGYHSPLMPVLETAAAVAGGILLHQMVDKWPQIQSWITDRVDDIRLNGAQGHETGAQGQHHPQ